MSISSDIYNDLKSNAALAALVGSRIYPITEKVGAARPWIVYTKEDQDDDRAMGATVMGEASYTFVIAADTHDEMETVVGALKNALRSMSNANIKDVECREIGQEYNPDKKQYLGEVTATIKHMA